MFSKFLRVYILLVTSCLVLPSVAQKNYQPSQANLDNREWFQDAKFGLFVHWGVYSVVGGGGDKGVAEWLMQQKQIPIRDYELLPSFFNPTAFDAEEWVQVVKDAGMNYICITSKHHDGFAMYDSDISDYNIVDSTPYGKDVLKLLADACEKHGIKLFFYYSQLDWHHPDYYPRGRTGTYAGRPDKGNWDQYINYMNAQLSELLTNYGPIAGIWFDGMWDKWDEDWQLDKTYSLIHELQPATMIGSNHHKMPFPGEDFQMFEKDLPGKNTAGFNQTGIGELPLESCQTMNNSWGFNMVDNDWKSSTEIIQFLVRAAGANANLLLNVGPKPNGQIQQENIDTLKVVGDWLAQYGESIYGTRGGPVTPREWGVTTQNEDHIFLHVLDAEDEVIILPDFPGRIASARYFGTNEAVTTSLHKLGTLIAVPKNKRNPIDTIIEITLK